MPRSCSCARRGQRRCLGEGQVATVGEALSAKETELAIVEAPLSSVQQLARGSLPVAGR